MTFVCVCLCVSLSVCVFLCVCLDAIGWRAVINICMLMISCIRMPAIARTKYIIYIYTYILYIYIYIIYIYTHTDDKPHSFRSAYIYIYIILVYINASIYFDILCTMLCVCVSCIEFTRANVELHFWLIV